METQADLDAALRWLVKADPRLRKLLQQTGTPELRRRPSGFAGLAMIIVGQQLSTASAAAIWGRLVATFGTVEPWQILAHDDGDLGKLGLSRAKTRTLKGIAREMTEQRLDLDQLATMDAGAAHAVLTALPGIGPWTADVYLLFCLGHSDAWPAGDLAVQEAIRAGLDLPQRPREKEMLALAEGWRPFRGAAAHLWWSYYRVIRRREGIMVPAKTPDPMLKGE